MRRLVLLALLVACGSKKSDPGPSCEQVTDHMLEITKQQLAGHGDQQLGDRTVMIQQCEKRKLSPAARNCLIAAKTLAAIAECQPSKPPPAGSGG